MYIKKVNRANLWSINSTQGPKSEHTRRALTLTVKFFGEEIYISDTSNWIHTTSLVELENRDHLTLNRRDSDDYRARIGFSAIRSTDSRANGSHLFLPRNMND